MTKFKTMLLASTVTGATLLGSGCIGDLTVNRLFNVWDFGISLVATLVGTNLLGGLLGGLTT